MLATLFVGVEIKGSRRWINIAGMSLQPSEFMKPAFVVICAWLFAENSRRTDIPGNVFALILLAIVVGAARRRAGLRPDHADRRRLGRAVLPGRHAVAVDRRRSARVGVGGIVAAYTMLPHVAGRIDRFLAPETGDTFQIDTAMESFLRGGWLGQRAGRGDGEAHPARRAYRLHLRRRGGGVRHHPLHRPGRASSPSWSSAGSANSLAQRGRLRAARRRRPRRALRRPGGDQHGVNLTSCRPRA